MLFKDYYFFLSTFYPCSIRLYLNNQLFTFSNAEAAFQAQKNLSLASKFKLLKGLESKRIGEQIEVTTENWETYKLFAMAKALNSKFKDVKLLSKLKQIKEEIVYENYWDDTYWGVCKQQGKNILGKMLMNIRDNNNDIVGLNDFTTKEIIFQ